MLIDGVICLAMKKTEEIKWKDFQLLDLFTYKKGNQKNMNALPEGETPLVSAKKIENGYKGFYKVNAKEVFEGNCITLNNDGDGGAGLSFYQPSSFALDTHVTALYPIDIISKRAMLFIACCISKQSILFGHGHSINASRLRHLTIMLPCDNSMVKPNYSYMEEFMRKIEKGQLKRYKKYLNKKKTNLQNEDNNRHRKKWKEFAIENIFDIKAGVRLTKQDMIEGNKPFIGSTDSNNGVTAFCGNTNASEDKNVLGVNYNGSVVENFYHPYCSLFSDDVKRFHLRHHEDNKYVLLFLKNSILQQQKKFRYGYKFNEPRMKKQPIMLPVNEDDTPDYKYMETCMRNVEQRIINRYIDKRLMALEAE